MAEMVQLLVLFLNWLFLGFHDPRHFGDVSCMDESIGFVMKWFQDNVNFGTI